MAHQVLGVFIFLHFKLTTAQTDNNCYLPHAVGSLASLFLVTEATTILIAVLSCLYLRHKARRDLKAASSHTPSASILSKYRREKYEHHESEKGDATIREVKNSLYHSINYSDVDLAMSQRISCLTPVNHEDTRVESQELGEELSKLRTRTQSSHAYELIASRNDSSGVNQQGLSLSVSEREGNAQEEESDMYMNVTPAQSLQERGFIESEVSSMS